MNKKLIALAVAASFAAPMAAHAAPTVYGKVHVSIDSIDSDVPDSGSTLGSSLWLSSNSSRLGVKGSDDLGGGLKAIYKYEFSVNPADSGTVGDTRNAYVGMSGGFGTFLMGRHDTPFKTVGRKIDLFGDQIGDLRNLTRAGGFKWDERVNNAVVYASPKFGGAMNIVAAYVLEDGTKDADALSASFTYKQGPLYVGAAYESHSQGLVAGTSDESAMRVGVSYKVGISKINAMYSTMSDINGATSNADADVMSIGASFTMGKNVIKVQYNTRDNDGTSNDGTTMALGFDHKFSKNTTGYVAYASTDNDANASYRMDDSGHGKQSTAPTAGKDPSGISVGMIVKF